MSLMRPAALGAAPRGSAASLTRKGVVARAAAGPRRLSLHVGETTIAVPLDEDKGKKLSEQIGLLLQTFSDKQKATRPQRWPMMEVVFKPTDGAAGDVELFEVMCNPNAYPSAFDAKMLITIKTNAGLSVTTEARLSNVKADVDAFVKA